VYSNSDRRVVAHEPFAKKKKQKKDSISENFFLIFFLISEKKKMGAYLSSPSTTKHTVSGTGKEGQGRAIATWAASAMQGWRKSMEDAHVALTNFDENGTHMFGVFDGHGGKEVAIYTAKHLPLMLQEIESFKSADYAHALRTCFLKLDENLSHEDAQRELLRLRHATAMAPLDIEEGDTEEDDFSRDAHDDNDNDSDDSDQPKTPPLEQHVADLIASEVDEHAQKEEQRGDDIEEEEDDDGKNELHRERSMHMSSSAARLGYACGTTAVVALITADQLVVANAGDSRAVLCRGGAAVALSEDHKPQLPGETKRIEAAGGFVIGNRVNRNLGLSRAIGDLQYKQNPNKSAEQQIVTALPDVRSVALRDDQDEFVVLACDGIFDVLDNQAVIDFVRPMLMTGRSAGATCEALMHECLAPQAPGIGCDNMTVVIATFPALQVFDIGANESVEQAKERDASVEQTKKRQNENESDSKATKRQRHQ
jgi:protein phosphatase 1G